ncbi:hypothetical protein HDV00_009436 [Rhizophlyctis rosea]|nr:hypothetical protein HDV00_009436 [Rhizophlyctis rosea]
MRVTLLRLSAVAALIASVTAQDACPTSTASFGIQADKYPASWTVASTGKENDPELLAVYNAIDWTKVPNSPIKPSDLSTTNYDVTSDPDCWWTATGCKEPKVAGLNADVAKCAKGNSWGLTFDDGPTCSSPALYDFLKAQGQKASFFLLGQQVLQFPAETLRAFQDGHDIMLHTWSHTAMTSLNNLQVVAELFYTIKIVQQVTGIHAKYWRPPYGDIDNRVRGIASQLGLTAVVWNEDSDDWIVNSDPAQTTQVDKNFQAILAKVNEYGSTSGPIVLEHDNSAGTVSIFKSWYPKYKAVYKNVQPVSSCIGDNPYWEGDVGTGGTGTGSTTTTTTTPSTTSSTSTTISTTSSPAATITTTVLDNPTTTTNTSGRTFTEGELLSTPTKVQDSPARKNDVGKIVAVAAGLAGLGVIAL